MVRCRILLRESVASGRERCWWLFVVREEEESGGVECSY
jgi:hypothetical protein